MAPRWLADRAFSSRYEDRNCQRRLAKTFGEIRVPDLMALDTSLPSEGVTVNASNRSGRWRFLPIGHRGQLIAHGPASVDRHLAIAGGP